MPPLKPGTLCIVVEGCRANIGQIVEVVTHIGPFRVFSDVYVVKAASGRPFNEVIRGWLPVPGKASVQYAQRCQLVPLAEFETGSQVALEATNPSTH